jgi:predicted nucleic acid-binding Zn ribbon protein
MVPTEQDASAAPCLREAVAMMKMCPLCHSEMPERYNYCYQCGEYVGDTAAFKPVLSPEAEAQQQQQERVIHYGCWTLIVLWVAFGLWFFFHMNR